MLESLRLLYPILHIFYDAGILKIYNQDHTLMHKAKSFWREQGSHGVILRQTKKILATREYRKTGLNNFLSSQVYGFMAAVE
jgi:photosystem II stability/assembly factor-like uncharacterized protein